MKENRITVLELLWSGSFLLSVRGYYKTVHLKVIGPKINALHWRHNQCDGVSNHRRLDHLLNRLLRHRSKKTSKLRVTGLFERKSQVTSDFPRQRASNAENVSIWWRHHVILTMPRPIQRWHRVVPIAWQLWQGWKKKAVNVTFFILFRFEILYNWQLTFEKKSKGFAFPIWDSQK